MESGLLPSARWPVPWFANMVRARVKAGQDAGMAKDAVVALIIQWLGTELATHDDDSA